MLKENEGFFNIETTNVCNFNCKMCGYGKRKSYGYMPLDKFKFAIEYIIELGFRNIQLTPSTGEVFMDPTIYEKLEYLEEHPNIDEVFFITNLSRCNIFKIIKFKKLQMTVSLYGTNPKEFEFITTSEAKNFYRVRHNILHLKKFGCNLEVALRDSDKNWDGRGNKIVDGMRIYINKMPHNNLEICNNIVDKNMITYNGDFAMCGCLDPGITMTAGNIFNGDDPYNSKEYKNYILEQKENKYTEVCKYCTRFNNNYSLNTLNKFNEIGIEV